MQYPGTLQKVTVISISIEKVMVVLAGAAYLLLIVALGQGTVISGGCSGMQSPANTFEEL